MTARFQLNQWQTNNQKNEKPKNINKQTTTTTTKQKQTNRQTKYIKIKTECVHERVLEREGGREGDVCLLGNSMHCHEGRQTQSTIINFTDGSVDFCAMQWV